MVGKITSETNLTFMEFVLKQNKGHSRLPGDFSQQSETFYRLIILLICSNHKS